MPVSSRGASKGSNPSYADDWDRLIKQPYNRPPDMDPDFKRLLEKEYRPMSDDEQEFKKLWDKQRVKPSIPTPAVPPPGIVPRRFGRKLVRLGLRRLTTPLDILDPLEPLFWPQPWQIPNPANGWYKCWGDCPTVVPDCGTNVGSSCSLPSQMCLGGQALVAGSMVPAPTHTKLLLMKQAKPVGSPNPKTLHSLFQRNTAANNSNPAMVNTMRGGFSLFPQPDPNLVRAGLGRVPQPLETPLPAPQRVPQAPVAPARAVSFGPSDSPRPNRGNVPQPIAKPEKVRPPAPPGRGVKEPPKQRGPVALIVKLFKIADVVSESCEVVDSVFEALPKEVQKAAKKKAGYVWSPKQKKYILPYGHTRAPADNYGQYGLDGCDWKAEAIYRHADKLDTCVAIQNVMKNQVEDKIHGVKEKYRPRNTVNGLKEADKQFGQDLNSLLDEIMDMCPK